MSLNMVTYICQNCNQSAGELPRVGILNNDQVSLCESCYKLAKPLESKWFYFYVQNVYKQWCLVGKWQGKPEEVKKEFTGFTVYVELATDIKEIWLILSVPFTKQPKVERQVKQILGYGKKAELRRQFNAV